MSTAITPVPPRIRRSHQITPIPLLSGDSDFVNDETHETSHRTRTWVMLKAKLTSSPSRRRSAVEQSLLEAAGLIVVGADSVPMFEALLKRSSFSAVLLSTDCERALVRVTADGRCEDRFFKLSDLVSNGISTVGQEFDIHANEVLASNGQRKIHFHFVPKIKPMNLKWVQAISDRKLKILKEF